MARLLALLLAAVLLAPLAHAGESEAERFANTPEALIKREQQYWKRTPLPVPDGIVLEVTGILAVPDHRLLVTTRHGEVWWVDGAYDKVPHPRFTLFASGLHEPLGIENSPKGGYYIAQREEITRVADTDGDGRADLFETVWKIPISGNYHEYAYGPVLGKDGNLRMNLNVAFGAPTQSWVPWRGWMVEVTPDGRMTPIAAGLRSPTSFIETSKGIWIFSENQGEWVGSGYVTQVDPGDFVGHPASLAWSKLAGSKVKTRMEDIPAESDPLYGKPFFEVAKKVPGMKLPAVWFPYTILGISTSGIQEDLTHGKFGPYSSQFYVGDQGQSKVMRMSLEKVKGVWQGAAYSFESGFESGVLRLKWGDNGSLFVGETNRGWGSTGQKEFALERLDWTGETPFEIKEIRATPDGFTVHFSRPADPKTAAKPASYSISGFTYKYWANYGSPSINRLSGPIRRVSLAPDHMSVRIASACLREGYIHEIKIAGVRAADDGTPALHDTAYYTLNRIPAGARTLPPADEAKICVSPVPASASAATPKHPTKVPSDWPDSDGDKTILLGTQPGLKFDTTELTVHAGDRIRLVFHNADDMLHNFVLAKPGQGQAVGQAALSLGLDGTAKNYVPDSDAVLFHTAVLQPGASDTIFFVAPSAPGDYDYICSFPGHYALMHGIFHVIPKGTP